MSVSIGSRSDSRKAASRTTPLATKASRPQSERKREPASEAKPAARTKRPSRKTATEPTDAGGWVGVDLAHFATGQPSRALLPLLVIALLVALAISSLRIDLIRTRYALAEAMAEERRLIEEQHALIVEKLQGRDPVELAVLAKSRGFKAATPARRLVDPLPGPNAHRFELQSPTLPQVAAAPPAPSGALDFEDSLR